MIYHSLPLLGFLVVAMFGVFSSPNARTWKNTDGQTIEAELVRVESANAILRMHGRTYRVPVASLSQADRDYLQARETEQRKAAATRRSAHSDGVEAVGLTTGKKGYCLSLRRYTDWRERLQALDVDWFYNWTAREVDSVPGGIEFVPMVTGNAMNVFRSRARLEAGDSASIAYVLTHNEPDAKKQANRSVEEVLDEWPSLMELGKPLISPGTVNPENEWMESFMQGIEERDYRVDYIAVHSYGGSNPRGFLNKLERVHEKYGRPIWITEFGVGDWQAETPDDNRHSPKQVLKFMREVLPELEKRDYIHRYAWFAATLDNPALATSALFDESGQLTPLGEFYAEHRSSN